MLEWVKDREHLREARREHADFLVLAFWAEFSDAAQRALSELEEFSREHEDVPVYVVDVEEVSGLHKEFDVETVPTVLALEDGQVSAFVEGVQSARFYAVHLSGAAPVHAAQGGRGTPRRVVVYSGPGCPACGRLKAYLRQHGVSFREVDISRDPRAAEKIARRSGKMAVPQTDINGRLVVGFNQAQLDGLLGIESGREEG